MTDKDICTDGTKKEINPRFWGLLSLAMKAGRLALGEERVQESVRGGNAGLIILASDASENTEKKFLNMAGFYGAEVIRAGDRYRIGSAVGKRFTVTAAVTDEGFSRRLLELYCGE